MLITLHNVRKKCDSVHEILIHVSQQSTLALIKGYVSYGKNTGSPH